MSPAQQAQQEPASANYVLSVSNVYKYKVFSAIKDGMSAVFRNPVQSLLAIVGAFLAVVAISTLAVSLPALLFASSQQESSLPIIITTVSIALIMIPLTQAGVANVILLSTSYGLKNKKISAVALLKEALKKAPRVAWITILLQLMIAAIPLAILGVLLLTKFGESSGGFVFLFIIPLLVILFAVLYIIAFLRYGLATQVAVFENKKAIASLKRSSELTKDGGRWFLFKLGLMLVPLAFILSFLNSDSSSTTTTSSSGIAELVFGLIALVAINSAATCYYFYKTRQQASPEQLSQP